jgi:hypothetical protein
MKEKFNPVDGRQSSESESVKQAIDECGLTPLYSQLKQEAKGGKSAEKTRQVLLDIEGVAPALQDVFKLALDQGPLYITPQLLGQREPAFMFGFPFGVAVNSILSWQKKFFGCLKFGITTDQQATEHYVRTTEGYEIIQATVEDKPTLKIALQPSFMADSVGHGFLAEGFILANGLKIAKITYSLDQDHEGRYGGIYRNDILILPPSQDSYFTDTF